MRGTSDYYYRELPAEREREVGLMPMSLDQQCHGPSTALCEGACTVCALGVVNRYDTNSSSISLRLLFLPLFISPLLVFCSANQSSCKQVTSHAYTDCYQFLKPLNGRPFILSHQRNVSWKPSHVSITSTCTANLLSPSSCYFFFPEKQFVTYF